MVDALGAFRSKMRLKKAVARVLANRMVPDDRAHLEMVFKKFDVDGNGRLETARNRRDDEAHTRRLVGCAETDGW